MGEFTEAGPGDGNQIGVGPRCRGWKWGLNGTSLEGWL